jgi:hypothetical protein
MVGCTSQSTRRIREKVNDEGGCGERSLSSFFICSRETIQILKKLSKSE